MSNIPTISLGSISKMVKGKKPSSMSSLKIYDTYLPYILIESFNGEYAKFTNDNSCKTIKEDDIGLVWDGERAGLVSIGHAGYLGSTLASITIDSDKAYPRFIYFALQLNQQRFRYLAEGTGIPHLSRWSVDNHPICYFQLPEQKKIASILASVDEVLENTQKQIDKLQDLKKATMNELLTKGIGHTEFKDSELGRIPKSWSVVKVGDFLEFKNGLNKEKQAFGKGQKIVNYMDVFTNPEISENNLQGRVTLSESESERFSVNEGDIFFTRTSETSQEIGLSASIGALKDLVLF